MLEKSLEYDYRLSFYKEIATLNEEHDIKLVQHVQNMGIFVRKNISSNSLPVYRSLFFNPVPNIPKIIEILEADGYYTVIEEYIAGKNFQQLFDEGTVFTGEEITAYMTSLCIILSRLHEMKPPIIHRDIKPSNVILTNDKRVFLIDFDGAKKVKKEQSRDTVLIGTQGYAAPEQYGFGASDIKTDIYGTGMLMKKLLSKCSDAKSKRCKRLGTIVRKCTQIDPKKRYSSALQLRKALISTNKKSTGKVLIPIVIVIFALVFIICIVIADKYSMITNKDAASTEPAGEIRSENAETASNLESERKYISTENSKHKDVFSNDINKEVEEGTSVSSPVGTYAGDDSDQLVISDNGFAYYYCTSISFTEVECPWVQYEDHIEITFSKMHCTVSATITDGDYSELLLRSDSNNWNNELFIKTSDDADVNIKKVIESASSDVNVRTDGSMSFDLGGYNFTIPKHFINFGGIEEIIPNCHVFVDENADERFVACTLVHYNKNSKMEAVYSDPADSAEKYSSLFMDKTQIGYCEEIDIGGKKAISVSVSGLFNMGFSGLSEHINTGKLLMIPADNGTGVIYIFMVQTVGAKMNDDGAFEEIMRSIKLSK